jgi:hypothetical protein
VSLPGDLPTLSPEEKIQAMQLMLRQLVDAGTLRSSWSRPLEEHLDHAARALAGGDIRLALEMLSAFRRKVELLQDKDRLPVTAAEALVALTDAVTEDLQGLAQQRCDRTESNHATDRQRGSGSIGTMARPRADAK